LVFDGEDHRLKAQISKSLAQAAVLQPVFEQLFVLRCPLQALFEGCGVVLIDTLPPMRRFYFGFVVKAR